MQCNNVEMKRKCKTSAPSRLILLLLLLSILVLVLVVITLAILVTGLSDLHLKVTEVKDTFVQKNAEQETCSSAECVQLSGELLGRMDTSVDPCDDFYLYACGGFISDPLLPTDVQKWATTSIMDKINKFSIKRVLEDQSNKDEDSKAFSKVRLFYNTCLNASELEPAKYDHVLKYIEELGSWPLQTADSRWDAASWQLEQVLGKAHRIGSQAIFMAYVTEDNKNSSIYRLAFNQASGFLTDSTFYVGPEAEDNRAALTTLVVRLVELLGGNVTQAHQMAQKVWQLDKTMADIKLSLVEYRADVRKRYNLMTLEEFQSTINYINMSFFLETKFQRPISPSETVIVKVPTVFQKLGDILASTDKSTLASYIVLMALAEHGPAASKSMRNAVQDFKAATTGGVQSQPDWQRCIAATEIALGFAVGALFTREHFTVSDKQEVVELIENVRRTFVSSVPSVPWMDEETKSVAIDKAAAVTLKIGFPDFINNPQELDAFYQQLEVTENHFLNEIETFKHITQRNLEKLSLTVNKKEWSSYMSPMTVNAFYKPQENAMIFPAGIIQKPMYHSSYPRALSYGAIGTIMGHELTHGFDTSGRRYDKLGNLNNWWGNKSAEEFERRTQCLIHQYNEYRLQGHPINGELTLAENIADNGGIRLSYRAYHSWLEQHEGKDKLLVGLNLTYSQMFFLGMAQTLCTTYKPQYIPVMMRKDPHCPAQYRVVGMMRNMDEFSQAFQCPKGTLMNPVDKCQIWT